MEKLFLFLDVDMTICKMVSWNKVHDFYKTGLENWTEKYFKKEITMNEWVDRDLAKLLTMYMPKDDEKLFKLFKFREGFEDFHQKFFDFFKKSGGVFLISGGFPPMIKTLGEKLGITSYSINYNWDGKNLKINSYMNGEDKKRIMKKYSKEGKIIYVADDVFDGHELDDYGPNITKIVMGKTSGYPLCVENFHQLDKLIKNLIKQRGFNLES